jgi:carbon monoxide dehydrogenase subunit G
MIFEGTFEVNAPGQDVWDFLLDVERVAKCVPGLERLEQKSETEYTLLVTQKVAFLKVSLNLKALITDADPPVRIESRFQGTDGQLGTSIKQHNTVELVELGPWRTEVRYRSELSFLGKLGTLGLPIIKAKANQIMNEFAKAVRSSVEGVHVNDEAVAGDTHEAL